VGGGCRHGQKQWAAAPVPSAGRPVERGVWTWSYRAPSMVAEARRVPSGWGRGSIARAVMANDPVPFSRRRRSSASFVVYGRNVPCQS
jgi:hypothetical protein